jgi:hypothetical protein
MAAFDNPGSDLVSGRAVVTTAGTAVQLTTTPRTIREVVITAETDNTGIVVVGDSAVVAAVATRKGTPLSAGDSFTVEVSDLANVFIDATVSTDGVTYTAVIV